MLVNYKEARVLTAEVGVGKPKLILVPGVNVLDDATWEAAKGSLQSHIDRGVIVPIYKVEKKKGKDGKDVEVQVPCSPDELPADKLDSVVDEIKSEAQAEKFEKSATKEITRVKAANRKNAIAKEIADKAQK